MAVTKADKSRDYDRSDEFWDPVPSQKIAAGNTHSLVVSWPGTEELEEEQNRPSLWAWGGNRYQQLGTASAEGSQVPLMLKKFDPSDEDNRKDPDEGFIVDVACGSHHSCVLECLLETDPSTNPSVLRESVLWSCGNNRNGQLGRSTKESKDNWDVVEIPVPMDLDVKFVVQRIACGSDHTLALVNFVNTGVPKEMGRVFAWGCNANGALGTRRPRHDEWTPTEVWFSGLDIVAEDIQHCTRAAKVVHLAAGAKHSLALTHDGKIYSWGHGGNGRLGLGKEKIGRVRKDGDSESHDLSYSAQFEPRKIKMGAFDTHIKFITAGESHSGAVDQLGRLYTWGQGAHGRCGHGMNVDIITPTEVDSLLGVAIKQIAFGMMHSVATTVKGTLYAWGKGAATALDAGIIGVVSTPTIVRLEATRDLENSGLVHQVAAGPLHTLVLMENGDVLVFGSGSEGRMPSSRVEGLEAATWKDRRIPMKVPPGRRESGTKNLPVRGWDQLKLDARKRAQKRSGRKKEQQQKGRKGWWPKRVRAGGSNSAVLLECRDVYVWGAAIITKESVHTVEGKGMPSASEDRPVPSLMKRGLQGKVVEIALGAEHIVVVTSDAVMFSWGDGRRGQLGTGVLKVLHSPTRINHPVDVVSISAGEEHSACIIEGGEAYTWGNAEGGRLGVGGCLTEGYEMMPKQVAIVVPQYDVLLEKVSCGQQHTAFVSKANELLTFGTGWFGRLGLGNADNAYTPVAARVPDDDLQASNVYCGAYHTFITDDDGVLWVTGRDTSVGKERDMHVTTPERFEHFLEPQRYIIELATCEQHTLAVACTRSASGKEGPAELWVWGDNRMGQLGLPPETAKHLIIPWRLELPNAGSDGKGMQVIEVATGPAHSLAVGMRKRHGPDGSQKVLEPEIYGWGTSTSGRLGIFSKKVRPSTALAAAGQPGQPHPKRRAQAHHDSIVPPRQVELVWRQRVEASEKPDENEDKDDKELDDETKDWPGVQTKLRLEKPDRKMNSLLEKEQDMSKEFLKFMDHIRRIWSPPEMANETTEWNLRIKEQMLETGYIRLLKALGLGTARFGPRIERKTKTKTAIMQRLQYWEEMLFILQQQPLYLANLAKRLMTKRRGDKEVLLYDRFCRGLFSDLQDLRTKNLFRALMRMLIKREIVYFQSVVEMFEVGKSRAQVLLGHMCTHCKFMKSLASSILDPKKKDSLVSRVIQYTLWHEKVAAAPKHNEALDPKPHKPHPHQDHTPHQHHDHLPHLHHDHLPHQDHVPHLHQDHVIGHVNDAHTLDPTPGFANDFDQYQAFRNEKKPKEPSIHAHAAPKEGEVNSAWITQFGIQAKYYCSFLVEGKDFSSIQAHEGETAVHPPDTLVPFIRLFVTQTLKAPENTDIQQLFRFAFEEVCKSPKSAKYKRQADGDGAFDEDVCTPLSAMLLGGIIGSVLDAVSEHDGRLHQTTFAMHRHMIKQEATMIAGGDHGADPEGFFHKVSNNIRTLGELLRECVNQLRSVKLPKSGAGSAAQMDISRACGLLTQATNKALLSVLSPSTVGRPHQLFDEDTTETELAVDLYIAHYNMAFSRVCIPTPDLLGMTNMLYFYMKDSEDGRELRLDHDKDKDPVWQLVLKTLPRAKTKKDHDGPAVSVMWDDDTLTHCENVGESHNLTIHHRFMEYPTDRLSEPTFCEESFAPMPRGLCLERQRKKVVTTARVVKPFRKDRDLGPLVEINPGEEVFGFELLEDIIAELSLRSGDKKYTLTGDRTNANFMMCRMNFEEALKDLAARLEEGMMDNPTVGEQLMKTMDTGIRVIDMMRETGSVNATSFFLYIDDIVVMRAAYFKYLEKMIEGKQQVLVAQGEYLQRVKDECLLLSDVCKRMDNCEIHDDILTSAQMFATEGSKLGFLKAKAAKGRMPLTPAMMVLKELKKNGAEHDLRDFDRVRSEIGVPSREFRSKDIIGKGVVVSLHQNIPNQSKVNFVVQCRDETYTVQMFSGQTLLKEFQITRQDVALMQAAKKNSLVTYGDGLVVMNAFRLRRLLAYLTAEGGL